VAYERKLSSEVASHERQSWRTKAQVDKWIGEGIHSVSYVRDVPDERDRKKSSTDDQKAGSPGTGTRKKATGTGYLPTDQADNPMDIDSLLTRLDSLFRVLPYSVARAFKGFATAYLYVKAYKVNTSSLPGSLSSIHSPSFHSLAHLQCQEGLFGDHVEQLLAETVNVLLHGRSLHSNPLTGPPPLPLFSCPLPALTCIFRCR